MASSTLKLLLKEWEHKKIRAEIDLEQRKKDLYFKIPELQKIDDEINKSALQTMKLLLNKNSNEFLDNLNNKINLLKIEKEKILEKNNIPINFFKPNYDCLICNDTGYVFENNKSHLCNCIKQKIFDIDFNKSNICNISKENFSTFNLNVYSDEINPEKYQEKISPRENILKIKQIADNFINNFDSPEEKNLLFTGNTGLGKTFLSNCIASELLKQGKTVLYQTSPNMLDAIINYKFDKPISSCNIYENILNVDLLIIDDLGTECMNSMKFTELFNIINSRLLNQHNHITKTIISTNLTLKDLHENYDGRIFSRLIGHYNICKFFGDDIRFLKK